MVQVYKNKNAGQWRKAFVKYVLINVHGKRILTPIKLSQEFSFKYKKRIYSYLRCIILKQKIFKQNNNYFLI
jgi:hypothetical protein